MYLQMTLIDYKLCEGCGIYITFSADATLIKICKIEFFVASVTKMMIYGFSFVYLELRKYFTYITTKFCKNTLSYDTLI